MEPSFYQGLFYLSLGAGSFSTLLLGLRALGSSTESPVEKQESNSWHHKEELIIIAIIQETHDIKTFRFHRANGKPFPDSHAGQFLSFQIGSNEKCLRSYSLSQSVSNPHTLQISVKKIEGGTGSGWFHNRELGDRVWAFPPSGLFTDHPLSNEHRVFVGGGIGITPLLSMVLSNIDRARSCRMTLFYGVRSSKDLAFHILLTFLNQRYPQFDYFPILSLEDPEWKGEKGYLTYPWMQSKSKFAPDAHFFFCGPPPMTDKIIEELLKAGTPELQIHSEKFASPSAFDPAKIPHREAKVSFQGESYSYSGKQTLLEFIESQGVSIPFSCRVGVCGTCKCRVNGKVEAITDAGLGLLEKRQGLVLSCVAFPLEDIELEAAR